MNKNIFGYEDFVTHLRFSCPLNCSLTDNKKEMKKHLATKSCPNNKKTCLECKQTVDSITKHSCYILKQRSEINKYRLRMKRLLEFKSKEI